MSYVDVKVSFGCYIIYWEIKGEVEDRVFEECCREIDVGFMDYGYVVFRCMKLIGLFELRVVE